MKNEEIINEYLDDKNRNSRDLKEELLTSKEFKLLNQIDSALQSQNILQVKNDFTFNLIKKIKSGSDLLKQHKKFAKMIFTSFGIFILMIVSAMFVYLFANTQFEMSTGLDELSKYFESSQLIISKIKLIINARNLSIVISVLAICIISTIYLISRVKKPVS